MNVSQDVLTVLSNCKFSANKLILPEQLDRATYLKTNKIIELAGGKWNRKEKSHLFAMDAESRIDQIILTASVDKPKDNLNFFPTPTKVIKQLLTSVSLCSGDRVLEPSCGDGRIVIAAHAHQPGLRLKAVEIEPVRISDLRSNKTFTETGVELVEGDYLSWCSPDKFDVILMNPPFVNFADVRHVSHAISMLETRGRLAAVMSAGVLFRETKLIADFRARVKSMGGEFIKLEQGSFKESGTMVNTVLLSLHL